MSLDAAEQAIREGDLQAATSALQGEIRADPSNPKLRVFLFQLLCVKGEWERALTQLQLAADLDAAALAMAQMYRETINCELLRTKVFAGATSPMIFGEPDEWLALLIESLLAQGAGRDGECQELRGRAFDAAPPSPGAIDDEAFEWIADADMRLGPVCEAIINGRYYWVPFARLTRIDLEAPVDLRDVVWLPAHFQFANGGEAHGVIPSRYPSSETADDALICLGRKTVWTEETPDQFYGLGQRVLATDTGDHAVMDVRTIAIGEPAASQPEETAGA